MLMAILSRGFSMFGFLVKEWKSLSITSYTAWAFYAIAGLTIAPDILYWVFGVDTNPVVWGRLLLAACFAGIVGRFVLQPHATRWRRRGIIAALLLIIAVWSFPALAKTVPPTTAAITFDLTSKWEGENKEGRLHISYQDIVGVWTVCYGHTRTAGPGQYKTDAECRDLLIEELEEYRMKLHVYFTSETERYRLPPYRDAAYTSLAYNVGIRGAGQINRCTALK